MAKKKTEEEKEVILKEEKVDLEKVKEELTDYMKLKVDKEVSIAVEKSTKKLLRHKNAIIIRRDFIIIILLIICLFLGFNLYKASNINIDITNKKNSVKEEVTETPTNEPAEEENPLQILNDKYGYLVDNVQISDESEYVKIYYKGELSDELKLYLSLNNLSDDKIISEDDSVYIDENDLKDIFNNMFDGEFNPKSFKYNDLNFHYLSSKSLFIADGKFEKSKSNIVKEIINIEEKESTIEITTLEGLIKNDKLYNILSNEQIKKYNSSESIDKYEDLLTNVVYSFDRDNNRLLKIEVM